MKNLVVILILSCFGLRLFAQTDDVKKSSTVAFHVFYNDFTTARQIKTSSLSKVLKNNLWSSIGEMQSGFGFNYLKGLTSHIDLISTLDASYTDYLFKNGTANGTDEFLLDANAGFNLKLLTDAYAVVPYISAGVGGSLYKGSMGAYVPLGLGAQFNLFKAAWVFSNMQYRVALSPAVNDHFQYNIGIGVSIGKHKKVQPPAPITEVPAPAVKKDTIPVVIVVKDITVTVTDEQTGLPLQGVAVLLSGPAGTWQAETDANGKAVFNKITAGDYTVSGKMHGINTSIQQLAKSNFETGANDVPIKLSHNDPRFTLSGKVLNKSTGQPEPGVDVNAENTTTHTLTTTSNQADGTFSMKLDAASDFSVSGKKGGYLSNIESVSTKGLNRSTTLYVKLQLAVEQTQPNRAITLSNIYYDTGSAKIRSEALADLEKLIRFLKDNPETKIEIDSHTDSRGKAATNLKLSKARAQGVVDYLAANGIAKSRLTARGFGATIPVNGCKPGVKCTDEQYAQNRRTEFKVIEQ